MPADAVTNYDRYMDRLKAESAAIIDANHIEFAVDMHRMADERVAIGMIDDARELRQQTDY
jgi:hypothetical protein